MIVPIEWGAQMVFWTLNGSLVQKTQTKVCFQNAWKWLVKAKIIDIDDFLNFLFLSEWLLMLEGYAVRLGLSFGY